MSENTKTVTTTFGTEREVDFSTWEMVEDATVAEQSLTEGIYHLLSNAVEGAYPKPFDDLTHEQQIVLMSMAGAWVQVRSILGELRNYAD